MSPKAKEKQMDYLLKNLPKANGNKYSEYEILCESLIESLKIFSGNEAVDLLTSSERIYTELLLALDNIDIFEVYIIIRKWEPSIRLYSEFRGFVYSRKLTALCQYCDILSFPIIINEKEKIERAIKTCFSELSEKLPFENCVLDFSFNFDTSQVIIIEINPYKHSTGAELFDWKSDEKILKGEAPFEFRIISEQPNYSLEQLLGKEAVDLLYEAKKELEKRNSFCKVS